MNETVGNAYAFLVIRDLRTNEEYGLKVEIANPCYARTGLYGPVELSGTFVSEEIVELDRYKNLLNEEVPYESE